MRNDGFRGYSVRMELPNAAVSSQRYRTTIRRRLFLFPLHRRHTHPRASHLANQRIRAFVTSKFVPSHWMPLYGKRSIHPTTLLRAMESCWTFWGLQHLWTLKRHRPSPSTFFLCDAARRQRRAGSRDTEQSPYLPPWNSLLSAE